MRLVTFATETGAHIGALLPGESSVSDFTAASDAHHFSRMLALINGGAKALEEARALAERPLMVRPLDTIRLERRETGVSIIGSAPPTPGFGSELIERHIARELKGEGTMSFLADGVCCAIEIPLGEARRRHE